MPIQNVSGGQPVQHASSSQGQPPANTMHVNGQAFSYGDQPVHSGADGKVFFASSGNQEVCIKEARGEGQQALRNEHDALQALGAHPNIIRPLTYEPASHRLALEKCEGALNNGHFLANLSHSQRGNLMQGLADAVSHMHDQRITHGDINLKNVLHQHGAAVLADFGGAKDFRHGDSVTLPQEQWMVDLGVPATTVTHAEQVQTDRGDLLKASYNLLCAKGNDHVIPQDAGTRNAELSRALAGRPDLLADAQALFGAGAGQDTIDQVKAFAGQLGNTRQASLAAMAGMH